MTIQNHSSQLPSSPTDAWPPADGYSAGPAHHATNQDHATGQPYAQGQGSDKIASRELPLSISAGAAHAMQDAGTTRDLYVSADNALYDAKRSGRGRVGRAQE